MSAAAAQPVVIVGAGINGIGVFRDLCLQGVQCLLIDKGDVGSGASSAPSRMIHGGLRYLENAEFSLVKEAAQERNNLLLTAPHLVQPLHTVIPLSSRLGGLFASVLRFFGANPPARSRGVLAVALAAVNVFGGFLVTRRMLEMFKKKERKAPATQGDAP